MFRDRAGHQLVRCPGCGLVFQAQQPSAEVLAGSYYHDPGFTNLLEGELREVTLRRAREHDRLLREAGALRSGARLLDVGCSSGAFLEVAAGAGLVCTGVELGAATAQAARKRGLDVRTGTLEAVFPQPPSPRFDLITFWDVLEHLHDPLATVRHAAGLLMPGGRLAASFPNVDGLYPQLTLRWLSPRTGVWEHPELPLHLFDFAPGTARRLLQQAGLDPVVVRTLPTDFAHLRATTLSWSALGRGPRSIVRRGAFELLRLVAYPVARALDRQNSMFVLAQKPLR